MDWKTEILNHLWQSTAFAAVIALTTLLLRRHSPRLRYWLWFTASIKFLIPFSLLVVSGAKVQLPPETPSLHATTVQQMSFFFSPIAAPAKQSFNWIWLIAAVWSAGAIFFTARWLRHWYKIHSAAKRSAKLPFAYAVPVHSSNHTLEPGVFGLINPILLLPEGLTDTLTEEQFEAILAHESRHVECRDNLTAALHMVVETLFWFHPLVWWIGARLVAERERDCDEAVLRRGSQPGAYARSIVHVCQTYVESPLPCASGIGGSDLKKRIREIMTWRGSLPITKTAKAALVIAAIAAVSLPVALGILRAQTLPPDPALTYDAVSIHKSDPGNNNHLIGPGPQGGWRATNMSVLALIASAYHVQGYQILGAPGWAASQAFDVVFTPDKTETPLTPSSGLKAVQGFMDRNAIRLQSVLRDRFGLVLRSETRELLVFNLVQAKGGAKLTPHTASLAGPQRPPGGGDAVAVAPGGGGPFVGSNGRQIYAVGITTEIFAQQLSMLLDRPVHDETHLTGEFDFKVSPEADGPMSESLFTALPDQLGLKLDSAKGPVQVYVVEKLSPPSEN